MDAIRHLRNALTAVNQASEALASRPLGDDAYWQTREVAIALVGLLSSLGHEVEEEVAGN